MIIRARPNTSSDITPARTQEAGFERVPLSSLYEIAGSSSYILSDINVEFLHGVFLGVYISGELMKGCNMMEDLLTLMELKAGKPTGRHSDTNAGIKTCS